MTLTGTRSGAGGAVAFASAIVFATGITLVAAICEDGAMVIGAVPLVPVSLRVPVRAASPKPR